MYTYKLYSCTTVHFTASPRAAILSLEHSDRSQASAPPQADVLTWSRHLCQGKQVDGGGVNLQVAPLRVPHHSLACARAVLGVQCIQGALRGLELLQLVALHHHATQQAAHQHHNRLQSHSSCLINITTVSALQVEHLQMHADLSPHSFQTYLMSGWNAIFPGVLSGWKVVRSNCSYKDWKRQLPSPVHTPWPDPRPGQQSCDRPGPAPTPTGCCRHYLVPSCAGCLHVMRSVL